MKKLIAQIIKFVIAGVIATAIDFSILAMLKEVFNIAVLVASAVSFAVSGFANYILSMHFVFKSARENKIKEFTIFVALSIGGLLLNQIIMWLGTEFASVYYLWVKVFASILVMIYNFVTRKVFLEKKEP